MAGSRAETQRVHMGRTWSPPGGMGLERQDIEVAHLPFSPMMYEARPLPQELPLGVTGQGSPSVERPLSAPLPRGPHSPSPAPLLGNHSSYGIVYQLLLLPWALPLQVLGCPSVFPPFPAARQI